MSFGVADKISYTGEIKNVHAWITLFVTRPFEILVFKCPTTACTSCLTYNATA